MTASPGDIAVYNALHEAAVSIYRGDPKMVTLRAICDAIEPHINTFGNNQLLIAIAEEIYLDASRKAKGGGA